MTDEARAARQDYLREYRRKNAERINEYNRNWRKANPDKTRAYNAAYWSKKAAERSGESSDN